MIGYTNLKKSNRCLICGSSKGNTLEHVIPYALGNVDLIVHKYLCTICHSKLSYIEKGIIVDKVIMMFRLICNHKGRGTKSEYINIFPTKNNQRYSLKKNLKKQKMGLFKIGVSFALYTFGEKYLEDEKGEEYLKIINDYNFKQLKCLDCIEVNVITKNSFINDKAKTIRSQQIHKSMDHILCLYEEQENVYLYIKLYDHLEAVFPIAKANDFTRSFIGKQVVLSNMIYSQEKELLSKNTANIAI